MMPIALSRRLASIVAIAAATLLFAPAAHGSIAFRLDQPGTEDSTPVAVEVTVSQQGEGLYFSVSVNAEGTGNTGDLRGLFFHVEDETALGGLSADGPYVTDILYDPNGVDDVGGGANMKGVGRFDVGIPIGTPGVGGDDVRSVTFLMAHESGPLDLHTFFPAASPAVPFVMAGRLGSVGPPTSNRNGSSKVLGNPIEPDPDDGPGGDLEVPPVPEMSSLAIWSSIIILGHLAARRNCPAILNSVVRELRAAD